MGLTYAGYPCNDPAKIINTCLQQNLPIDWAPKVNRFVSVLGAEPGRGWVLMNRQYINLIDQTKTFSLIFDDGTGGHVEIQNLLFIQASCITPGLTGDPFACFLVELRDVRHLAQNEFYAQPINRQYNVRAPATATYYDNSMLALSPFTWQQVFDDIWSQVNVTELGSSPTLPFTPDGTPENLRFIDVPAWQAYNELLFRVGCAFAPYPQKGTFSIARIGSTNAAYTTALQTYAPNLTRELDIVENSYVKVPAKIVVAFHKFVSDYGTEATTSPNAAQWSIPPTYEVVIDKTLSASQRNSVVLLWDDLAAVYDASGNLLNSAALNSRALERANDYFRMVYTGGNKVVKAYSRIIDNAGFIPNEQVSGVAWIERGVGYITEISHMPPPLKVGDDGQVMPLTKTAQEWLSPPDLSRATFPNYPDTDQFVLVTNTTNLATVWAGKVFTEVADTGAVILREKCWIKELNGVALTVGRGYRTRANGILTVATETGQSLPVARANYIADTGSSGNISVGSLTAIGFWARLTGATLLDPCNVAQVSGGSVGLGLYNCIICYLLSDGSIVRGTRPQSGQVKVSASTRLLSFTQPLHQIPANATGWAPYIAFLSDQNGVGSTFLQYAYYKQGGQDVWNPMGTLNVLLDGPLSFNNNYNLLTNTQSRKSWNWVEQQPITGLPGTMEDKPGGRSNVTTGLLAFEVNGFDPDTVQVQEGNRPTVWLWQSLDSSCYFYQYDEPIQRAFTTCCPPGSTVDTLHATILSGGGCNWTGGVIVTLNRITAEEWQGAITGTVNGVSRVVSITFGCARSDEGAGGFSLKIQCDNGPMYVTGPVFLAPTVCSPFSQTSLSVGFNAAGWGGCCPGGGSMGITITE